MYTVGIRYEEVKRDVLRMSEYIGLKSGMYDHVRAISSDDEQLRHWYKEGVARVCSLLDRVIARKVEESDETELSITVGNDLSKLDDGALRRAVVSHILVRWLRFVAPSLVEAYAVDEAEAFRDIERICYFREMPR